MTLKRKSIATMISLLAPLILASCGSGEGRIAAWQNRIPDESQQAAAAPVSDGESAHNDNVITFVPSPSSAADVSGEISGSTDVAGSVMPAGREDGSETLPGSEEGQGLAAPQDGQSPEAVPGAGTEGLPAAGQEAENSADGQEDTSLTVPVPLAGEGADANAQAPDEQTLNEQTSNEQTSNEQTSNEQTSNEQTSNEQASNEQAPVTESLSETKDLPEDGEAVRQAEGEDSLSEGQEMEENIYIPSEDDISGYFSQLRESESAEAAYLGVEPMIQNPELPNGCESVSLTMVLRYLGFDIEKTLIADEYLPYGDHFVISYVGDPRSDDGAGIYAPGIARTANDFLAANGSDLVAYDLTGTPMEDLFLLVGDGHPVILWGTINYQAPSFTYDEDEYKGENYFWFRNEHCLVLRGYDMATGKIELLDPLLGEVTIDRERMEAIYNEIGSFAVVIM